MKPSKIIRDSNSSEFMRESAKAISLNVSPDNWQNTATIPVNLIFSDSNYVSAPLINGDEIFSKYAELIEGAQREILLQTFAYEAQSNAGKKFLAALKTLQEKHKNNQQEALKKGEILSPIDVCILISKASGLARKFMHMTTGVKSNWKPTKSEYDIGIEFDIDPTVLNISVKIVFFTGAGFHSKSLIIDGQQAIITGANFQARNHGSNPCFDLGFSFFGNIANSLRAHFITTFNSENAQSEHGIETVDLTVNNPPSGAILDQTCLAAKGFKAIQQPLLTTARNVRNLGSENNTQNIAFKTAFTLAKVNINLITPNLNADFIKDLIVNAVKRGVLINIVLPKYFNDSRQEIIGGGTNRATVRELYSRLEKKDNKNLNIKWYRGLDKTQIDGYANVTHAKFSIFDNRICITGSTNLDRHSIYHGRELNVVAEDEAIISAWNDEIFMPIFKRSQSVDEQYKDYKETRIKLIAYLENLINMKIHANYKEEDRTDCLCTAQKSLEILDLLADKVANIRGEYKGSNEARLSVINQLELSIVNAYTKLQDDSLYSNIEQFSNFSSHLVAQINCQTEKSVNLLKSLYEQVKREHQEHGKLPKFFQSGSRLVVILASVISELDSRACKLFCVNAELGESALEFDSESIHSRSPIM